MEITETLYLLLKMFTCWQQYHLHLCSICLHSTSYAAEFRTCR